MKKCLSVMVVLMNALVAAAAQENPVFQDDLLDHLVGTWIVKGTAHACYAHQYGAK